ncbi:MAG: sigma-70 family RNA polymerase sigma factor [Elusimicrobia bacterium]|nr:sigma-70 family RNA polymerase sigma factor [Elusimicrobiota bacterium]
MTDEALAELAKEGDHGAFEQLVRRYQGTLYSYLAYRAGRSAAEDLFQEICVKWWTHMRTYESRGRFAGWAFTIARRALIDHVEKEGRRKASPLEGEQFAEPLAGPERLAESTELSGQLARALSGLSEEQREVFLLREYGGLSFKEIAAAQGCPLNTALARMRYALLKLRASLEAQHG